MDRPMKKRSAVSPGQWDSLLSRIQSHSTELESGLAQSNSNLIEALSGLAELEALTASQLSEPLSPQAHATAAAEPPTVVISPNSSSNHSSGVSTLTPKSLVTYQTSHEEYAPALNQDSLVEALLKYQRAKALRTPKATAAAKPASPAAEKPSPSSSDFAPMRIPSIQAEPKSTPLGRAAAPGVRLPVLRHKPSSGSGNSDDSSQN